MSSLVTDVFKLTFGLVCDKFRDYTASILKEGDITDEQCRQLIVRDLDDIKTKLNALARKDLLSSVSFLKEGICFLKLSLDKSTGVEATFPHEKKGYNSPFEEQIVMETTGNSMRDGQLVAFRNEVASLEFPKQIIQLNITSTKRFAVSELSFKAAREKATEAFCNEALSTEDRILATKLRVMARILESLQDPDAAAEACKLYLEELHDVAAIREMFSVYLGGRLKSLINKHKRRDNVISITLINFALFAFTKRFTKIPLDLFNWPRIELGEQIYHPMMPQNKILSKVEQSGAKPPNQFAFDVKITIDAAILAINSDEVIIGKNLSATSCNVISRDDTQLFCSFPNADTEETDGLEILSLAIDEEDNVYVAAAYPTPTAKGNYYKYKLIVLDAKGNMKYQFQLEFLNGEELFLLSVAVAKDKMIIIHRDNEECLWVCDSKGKLLRRFRLEEQFYDVYLSIPLEKTSDRSVCLSISDKNEIIVAPRSGKTIYIYSAKGALKKTFEVLEDHEVVGVAFNHATKKVAVVTQFNFMAAVQNFLLSYSETGEQEQALQLLFKGSCKVVITSHPSGPIALVHEEGVLFI